MMGVGLRSEAADRRSRRRDRRRPAAEGGDAVAELLVIAYEDEGAADQALAELVRRSDELGLDLDEAMVVRRAPDGTLSTPETPSPASGMKKGALIGGIAGFLLAGVGAIPGALVGTAIGGLTGGALGDDAIGEDAREQAAMALSPGSSALLLLGTTTQAEAVMEVLASQQGRVIRSSIPEERLQELRAALAAAP
jgi:uncharacterized membrane protein